MIRKGEMNEDHDSDEKEMIKDVATLAYIYISVPTNLSNGSNESVHVVIKAKCKVLIDKDTFQ